MEIGKINFFMKKYPRIIFIGDTNFSIICLKKLLLHNYYIVGVITNPDNKNKTYNFSLKKFSLNNGIYVLQPRSLKDINFLNSLYKLKADLQIVVSFKFLPKKVWSYPSLGTFNLHPSFLPKYRGAAPIQWSIINGDNETGLTTFLLNEKIDQGKILLQKKVIINNKENMGLLKFRLSNLGADLIIKTIQGIINNKIQSFSQKIEISSFLKKAPKIYRKDCRINWNKPIKEIYNKIRGLSPYPSAYTTLLSEKNTIKEFKIINADYKIKKHNKIIGLIKWNNYKFKIYVKNGYIFIIEGQLEGKKKMNIKNIFNGLKKKYIIAL